MSNIDEQVKVLSDQLNLTPDQQSKLRTILMDQHEQAMALIQDNSMDRDTKVDKIHALRANTIAKVRGTLTNEQKPKFDAMVQQQDEHLKEQQQRDQGGASSSPSGGTTNAPSSGTSPSSTEPGANPPASTPPPTNPPSNKPPQ